MTTLYAATGSGLARIVDGTVEDVGVHARCVAVDADGDVYAGGSGGVDTLAGDVFSVAVGADGAVYAGGESWADVASLPSIVALAA